VAFLQTPPLNTFALILIMVWLQTGFAMVILSAAIKGVPDELVEAARIDGATELQVFRLVIVPTIRGSIITVATTVLIAILKVFDIVFVTTGGRFDTDVIANRMFQELIRFRNPGRASALAVVLVVAVLPIMVMNVRNLRRQGVGA
jgi:alpha-glucoside transport system permease protein